MDAGPVISAALGDYITQAFALALSGADNSVMADLFGAILMEKTELISTGVATATIEFVCVCQDDEWKIQDLSKETQYMISNIISCNMIETFESFGNNLSGNNSENSKSIE